MGYTVDDMYKLTNIDRWFLYKLFNIYEMKQFLIKSNINFFNDNNYLLQIKNTIYQAKKMGFSDKFLFQK